MLGAGVAAPRDRLVARSLVSGEDLVDASGVVDSFFMLTNMKSFAADQTSATASLPETASTSAQTMPIRPLAIRAKGTHQPKPTLRTALRDLERSLFDAFEAASRDQFER